MIFYFAPLEGLTGAVYRRAHAAMVGGVDKYFTPFYSPGAVGLSKKEIAELDGDDRAITVPQLLTKRPAEFLTAAGQLYALGYREVNLNFGCPSGTVSAKHKGAGFLQLPDDMYAFFEEIFAGVNGVAPGMQISVKTRIGYSSEDAFPRLLEVYNQFPIKELIVHPRLRQDFYRGHPRYGSYAYAQENAAMPLCYNGDIFSLADYEAILQRFPATTRVMIGRGAVADPTLFLTIRGQPVADKRACLRALHDRLLEENSRRMGVGNNLLCRMADLWNYQIHLFAGAEQARRRIRQAANLAEYRAAVATLFREHSLLPDGAFVPPQK